MQGEQAIQNTPVIAVDGPGGTGKGSLCGRLAENLGWHLLDSGALYRVLGYVAISKNISLTNTHALEQEAVDLDIAFFKQGELVSVFLAGEDISQAIRTEQCGNMASKVAAIPEVRNALFERQKSFRQPPGLVADGRDMGTVVFPQAPLKIYLTAEQKIRAERRYKQLKGKGNSVTVRQLIKEIAERDKRDSQRLVAPLKPAVDAIIIDTSYLSLNDVEKQVMAIVSNKGFV